MATTAAIGDADFTLIAQVMNGPVQLNETKTIVNAIKKMPSKPPRSLALSLFSIHELGMVISNAPKNEIAKMMKTAKNAKLKNALLAHLFKLFPTKNPSNINNIMMLKP